MKPASLARIAIPAALIAISGAPTATAVEYPIKPIRLISEAGLPGFDANNWYGLLAPAKTPRRRNGAGRCLLCLTHAA